MTDSYDHVWDDFVRRFKNSRPPVFKVAEYLNREKDCTVEIPRMVLAPDQALASHFQDNGDIIVNGKHIVEVKGKSLAFTCKEDFRFPDIIVANVASADRHNAYAFFIVNNHMTHAAMILASTKPYWTKRPVEDKYRGTIEEKYICPIDLVEFVKL